MDILRHIDNYVSLKCFYNINANLLFTALPFYANISGPCNSRVKSYDNDDITQHIMLLFRGYYTAVFISTHISRSSVDYQPEAKA